MNRDYCDYCSRNDRRPAVRYFELIGNLGKFLVVRALCEKCYQHNKSGQITFREMTAEEYVIWSVHNT